MRRVLEVEVKAIAVALTKLSSGERRRMCNLWIHQAHWSHKYMKKHGKPHPVWGNGSLLQAVHIRTLDDFVFSNAEHCSAMETVLNCLAEQKISGLARCATNAKHGRGVDL